MKNAKKTNNMDPTTKPFAAILARHLSGASLPLKAESIPDIIIPALAEAFRAGQADAARRAVGIYSEYLHSAEVITGEDGKKYMEIRLRWEVPGQESPESRVYGIADENPNSHE